MDEGPALPSPVPSVPARPDLSAATAIPPDVDLEDGISRQDAVAIALWNNPDFRLQLTELGFARADLLEAGLLKNPVLSLLFPVGPKQLEATLRFPIEVLWERPRRVAAATHALDRVAAQLEQRGLDLVADVKVAVIDLALARDRAQLLDTLAAQLEQIREIASKRLRAGDISALETRSAEIDAARARQDAERAMFELKLLTNILRARLGLALDPTPIVLADAPDPDHSCTTSSGLSTGRSRRGPMSARHDSAVNQFGTATSFQLSVRRYDLGGPTSERAT